ncbi:hypothetical protein B0H13DRAFT_1897184 [Mycena leptocephala]|nr:hypothetical protein B0H13DRAFT_1897184 [Mycena leptocephala]
MCVPTSAIAAEKNCSAICGTDRCACYLTHHECHPELCLKCQAKCMHYRRTSVITQTFTHKSGACARTPAVHRRGGAKNDLIIVYDLTTEPIAEHRGWNYLFGLNNMLSIDGMYVGNNTRYINQDAEPKLLCEGEHWIGIYATRPLKLGEEVVFNHGDQPRNNLSVVFSVLGLDPDNQIVPSIHQRGLEFTPRRFEIDLLDVFLGDNCGAWLL